MYKIFKDEGLHSNVALENTETKARLDIGRISISMLDILSKAGYKEEDNTLKLVDKWELPIDKEYADEMSKLTMRMKKPIRDQRKKATKKEENKKIDAMDVLLGLAQYN